MHRAMRCSKRLDGLGTHDFRTLCRLGGLLANGDEAQLNKAMSLSEVDVVHRAACVAGTGK